MAQVKIENKKVKKMVEVEEEIVTLELTREEAEAIASLTGATNSVGQKFTETVFFALSDSGVDTSVYTPMSRGKSAIISLSKNDR